MASFSIDIDQAFVKMLTSLGERTDAVAQLMLDDAGQTIGDELEKNIRSQHVDTGELADSIEVSDWKNDDGSWHVWAYPAGRSKTNKRTKSVVYSRSKHETKTQGQALYNADKLWFIENGTSRQPARPFIDRMLKNIEGKIKKNMQEIFEREVKK